jgi:hypothetical protein
MNTQTTPKDFFLHLAATVALYAAVGSLINLAFSVINYFNPDTLAGYFYSGSVAWPISMLIVLVPVLYLIEWLITRDIRETPKKKEMWIRRWRTYLTIFLAAILMIGDLITLLNVYLSGEISSRFVYKVIVIILVAGAVGKYYFFDLYEKYRYASFAKSFNAWFGIVLVLAAIVAGFIAVGSPAKQRDLRFDNQRISDLTNIQWQIINHWQTKEAIPATLADLNDPLSGFSVPTDPETKAAYGYTRVASTTFSLCATFGQPSQDVKGRGSFGYGGGVAMDMAYPTYYPGIEGEQWDHEAGNACFERKIDPSRYPVNPKPLIAQ